VASIELAGINQDFCQLEEVDSDVRFKLAIRKCRGDWANKTLSLNMRFGCSDLIIKTTLNEAKGFFEGKVKDKVRVNRSKRKCTSGISPPRAVSNSR
jgi:hypothetical protein